MGNFIIVLGVALIILSLIGAALDANNKHLPVHNGAKEKDDMYNYFISLKTQEENKTKHSIKCYNCKQIVDYTDNDVKDAPFVICLECKTEICILD